MGGASQDTAPYGHTNDFADLGRNCRFSGQATTTYMNDSMDLAPGTSPAIPPTMNATNPGTSKARSKTPTIACVWADSLNHGRVFPWYSPTPTTGEMVQLASAIKGSGGRSLIAELEG